MRWLPLILWIWIGAGSPFFAQDVINIDDLLEGLEDESVGQTDFWQILQTLEESPLNVNRAGLRELLQIPFLTEEMARSLVTYRREHGDFATPAELLDIPHFNEELVTAILPYIRFSAAQNSPRIRYRTQSATLLHQRRGDIEQRYADRWQLYQRLQWQPRDLLNITAIWEKDAGEENWADFGSFSLRYDWAKAHSVLIVGDYNIAQGQQLTFGNAYGMPLLVNSFLPYRQQEWQLRAKSDVDENAFLRGVAWLGEPHPNWLVSLFASAHHPDATIDSGMVKSFYTAGLHRTATEQSKVDAVRENVLGIMLRYRHDSGYLGFSVAQIRYSLPVSVNEQTTRQRFGYLNTFWHWRSGYLESNGEVALLDARIPAVQHALQIALPEWRWRYGLAFYYYAPDYWAYHGRGLGGISQSPQNALGVSANATFKLTRQLLLGVYFGTKRDIRNPTEFPATQSTRQLQLVREFSDSELLLRYTRKQRLQSDFNTAGIRFTRPVTQHIGRIQWRGRIATHWQFTQRVEVNRGERIAGLSRRYGFAMFSDMRYRHRSSFLLQARWTMFDVPDFSYAIYEFENDLPGAFRNVLLNGRGYKWFVLAGIEKWNGLRLYLKYQKMVYPDAASLGSGLDEVLGNAKQVLRIQLQIVY
jgi:hypothetical protein